MGSNKNMKIETAAIIFALVMLSVFVPMLVSAASTVQVILGVSLLVGFITWTGSFVLRLINNSNESIVSNEEVL